MTIDETKMNIQPFGSFTAPAILPDSAALMSSPPAVPISAGTSVGPLGSMDFTKMSVSNILPNLLSNMPVPQLSMPAFTMPDFSNFSFIPMNFNFSTPQYNFGTSYTDNFTRTTGSYLNYSNFGNGTIKIDGYNASKGTKLARIADQRLNHASKNIKQCAQSVREDLQAAGLFNGMKGHGYQYINILRQNSNFKEIPVQNENWKHLPAGCIVVYDKGVGGHSKTYGDVGIITEDGQQTSFYKTSNIAKPTAIFVPV